MSEGSIIQILFDDRKGIELCETVPQVGPIAKIFLTVFVKLALVENSLKRA